MALCLTLSGGSLVYAVDASYSAGAYSCTSGAYLALTTQEINGLTAQPFAATSEHYAAVTAIFGAALTALCIIWGVKKVLTLINQHTDS